MGNGFCRTIAPRFGSRTGFAGIRGAAFGITLGRCRGARNTFCNAQRICGSRLACLGIFDLLRQFCALARKMVGFVLRILQLSLGLNAAGVQLRHAGLGGIKTLLPPIYFACNLVNAAFPRFAFAFDLVMRRAFGQHRQARSLDCRFRAFNPRAHCREVFKGFLPRLSFNQLPLGTCGFLAMAADGLG